ncbi:MAG: DUF3750 domain-containing protein [Alphaproteobacteria bacterium]|nr:DUF3750 domain-containing protein [Alphaproteobacteria bacterium]
MKWVRRVTSLLLILMLGPVAVATGGDENVAGDWRTATRQSSGLAPKVDTTPEAVVQVYAARAFSWRGAFAVHTWISVKPENAKEYTVYEVMGWYAFGGGSALQIHNDETDRYWFGARPELLTDLRGAKAAKAIKDIRIAVKAYPYAGTYTTWPGPNSNTFTAFVTRRVPELSVDLPPTAIGKDYLPGGSIFGKAPSGGGAQFSIFGALGILVSKDEGIEFNILGLSFGIDPGDLAIRLPGVGKIGLR